MRLAAAVRLVAVLTSQFATYSLPRFKDFHAEHMCEFSVFPCHLPRLLVIRRGGCIWIFVSVEGRSDAWRLDAVAPVGLNSHLFAGMLLTCFHKQMLTGNAPYHFERRLEQRNPPLQHLVLVMDRGDSHGAALELEVHGPITVRSTYVSLFTIIMKNNKQTKQFLSSVNEWLTLERRETATPNSAKSQHINVFYNTGVNSFFSFSSSAWEVRCSYNELTTLRKIAPLCSP